MVLLLGKSHIKLKAVKSWRIFNILICFLTNCTFIYCIFSTNANNANLSLAEYARKQIMNKKVIVKYELVADLPELKKLTAEFGKIGSNLNQSARHFNTGGIHSQEMRKAINEAIADIYEI